MTINLDALEKLAADLRVSWSERGWVASKKIDGLLKEARQASDGLTALIAELKEARGLLQRWRSDLPTEALEDLTDAFLTRNGKGEG